MAAKPESLEARSELAATHNTLGRVLQDLGRWPEAGVHLRRDLEIRRVLQAVNPDDPRRRDLQATSQNRLGDHLSTLGQWVEATEHFAAARSTFEELVAHDPANAPWRVKLSVSHLLLTRAAYARGDLVAATAALEAHRRWIDELLIPVPGPEATAPPPHAWRRTRAVGLYHSALVQLARGQGAREEVLDALGILDELAVERPTDRSVRRWRAQSYLLLGELETSPTAATTAFRAAEAITAGSAHDHPDPRLLAPWVYALKCLGRGEQARDASVVLTSQGYSEPGLIAPCPETS